MSVTDEIRMYVTGCGFDGKSVSRGDLIKMGYSASDVIDALPAGSLPTDPKLAPMISPVTTTQRWLLMGSRTLVQLSTGLDIIAAASKNALVLY
jgi:hypothetical protein